MEDNAILNTMSSALDHNASASNITDRVIEYMIDAIKDGNVSEFVTLAQLFRQANRQLSQDKVDTFFVYAIVHCLDLDSEPRHALMAEIINLYRITHEGETPFYATYFLTLPYPIIFNISEVLVQNTIVALFRTIAYLLSADMITQNSELSVQDDMSGSESNRSTEDSNLYVLLPEIMDDIIKIDDPDSSVYVTRLFYAFPMSKKYSEQYRNMLRPFVERAYEETNNVFEPLFQKMVEVSTYAPIPPWVKNFVYNPYEDQTLNENSDEGGKLAQWVAENPFTFEPENPQIIYTMIENQDISHGKRIQADEEENEFAEFDTSENQLPFQSLVQLPDYPTVYPIEHLLEVFPHYWETLWEKLKTYASENQDTKIDIDMEEEREYLLYRLLSMPLYLLNILFEEILGKVPISDIMTDAGTFRVLGPRNSIPADTQVYGGERMFISNVYDFNEETNESYYWFSGYCLNCALKIRRFTHAVRVPVKEGGWKGCYCSLECALKQIDDDDVLSQRLLEEIGTDLNTIGIQDYIVEDDLEGSDVEDSDVEADGENGTDSDLE